jgi:hypothetical protein
MQEGMDEHKREEARQTLPALLMICGFLAAGLGYGVVSRWDIIGTIYAAIGVLWCAAGILTFLAGLGALLSAPRRRTLLLCGGLFAALSGTALAGGLLANIIPCAGIG